MPVECAGVSTAKGDCRDPGHQRDRAAAATRRHNAHAGNCDQQSGVGQPMGREAMGIEFEG